MSELFLPELPLITDIVGQAAYACDFLHDNDLPYGLHDSEKQALGPFYEHDRYAHCDALSFPEAQKLCLVMIDGLGMELLQRRLGHARFLRSLLDSSQSMMARTCLPSSTACAIPSLTTGYLPGQSGMMGYEALPERGEPVVNMLQFSTRDRIAYPHDAFLRYPTIFQTLTDQGRKCVGTVPRKFLGSAMTDITLAGCQLIAAKRLMKRCELAVDALHDGADLSYVYWDGIDHTGHGYGWNSLEWEAELEATDSAMKWLCTHVPRGTLVVIVADHGMVDVDPHLEVNLPVDAPELLQEVGDIAGEPRALHVYLRHIEAEDDISKTERRHSLITAWQSYFQDSAIIVSAEEAHEYYGSPQSDYPTLYPDMTVFMTDRGSVVHDGIHSPAVRAMKGMHGSITADEVHIPVVVALR